MIADIFYPIFTITILACFTWKKNVWGFTPMPSLRHRPGPPGGLTAPPNPNCNCFWCCQKLMCPYFFCIIPWQYFHDWFYILRTRYNSDMSKPEWTLLLLNFKYIRDLTNRCKLFSIPVAKHASFSRKAKKLKTNLLGLI